MTYHISKTIADTLDGAVEKVTAALQEEGFGVLTDIDVQATLKKKIGADFRGYRILGSCNPHFAHQALKSEDRIGTMLPCNVIVQERDGGIVEVSAVDPMASMQAIENSTLEVIASEVRQRLTRVIGTL